jgi:hypothetical protein
MVNDFLLLSLDWEKFAERRVKERLLPGRAAPARSLNPLKILRFIGWHGSR